MRVVCDNCSATYRIPDQKLTKEVNKATCRKCGHRMLIQRPGLESAPAPSPEPLVPPDEATVVSGSNPLAHSQSPVDAVPQNEWSGPDSPEAWSDAEAPTKVQTEPPPHLHTDPNPPLAHNAAQSAPQAPAVPSHAPAAPRVPATPKPMVSQQAPQLPKAYKPKGDLTWVGVGAGVSILGAVILAFNFTNNPFQSLLGLFAALLGSLGGLAILFTGNRGTHKASILISGAGALLFALVGAGAVQAAINFAQSVGRNVEAALQTVDDSNTLGKKTADDTLDELLATGGDASLAPTTTEADKIETEAEKKEDQEPVEEKVEAETPAEELIPPDLPADGALDALAEEEDTDAAAAAAELALQQAAEQKKKEEEKKKKEAEEKKKKKEEAEAKASSAKSSSESAGGSKMATLPAAVVDTIVRNNSGVKKCFIAEKQRTGSFPSRVDVRFTVRPDGSVRSARVSTSAYRGSDLDACLGSAFRKLSFPAFEGGDKTITYPFIL